MPELDELTHAYLRAHPVDAARELERLPAGDVAALFGHAPARLVAPVAEAMLTHAAAAAVLALPEEQSALILGAMRAPGAAGVLRHAAGEERRALLAALPTTTALACRALLRYPEDAVGALVDSSAVALPESARADEALAALRQRGGAAEDVYVVADAQRLAGAVSVATLLGADPAVRLAALKRPVPSLPALMPCAAAASSPGWDEAGALPVVEHGGRLVGVLTAPALRRALATRERAGAAAGEPSLAGVLGQGYWLAVSALSEAAVATLLPRQGGRRA